jgi:hypothetical protein
MSENNDDDGENMYWMHMLGELGTPTAEDQSALAAQWSQQAHTGKCCVLSFSFSVL